MLLAVLIFFTMAGMFFLVIMYNDLYDQANLLEQKKAISTVMNIANTPEFSCGEPQCIDSDKLLIMQGRKAYQDFWPITSFVVTKIGDEETIPCNEKNYPNCNYYKILDTEPKSEQTVETYVSLRRKEQTNNYIYDKYDIARIIIGFEVKQP